MKIGLGCDHAGFEVKKKVKEYLSNNFQMEIVDFGTNTIQSVDYPKYGHLVGKFVSENANNKGIVICGSGIGISIAANKIKGARAALCTTVDHAIMSRKHNDSNILALGARLTSDKDIISILNVWLNTNFEAGRHLTRINQIEDIK